ncbi:MAG: hypothetical protein K2Q18_04260 [Bdellovibrionales bacterium]|nr:hypothetical protein [Bdellovibrionales bacterium]
MHKMQKTWIFYILISIISQSALRAEDFSDSINNFLDAKELGNPSKNCDCDFFFETSTLYSPVNKKTITLSIISSEKATSLFKTLKEDHINSFNLNEEGCFARAHRMAQMLDEEGVLSGKIFAEGSIPFKGKNIEGFWSYHTASVILVRKKGKIIPTVIDPVLFDKPVSVDEWKKKLLKHPKAKIDRTFYTKRFIFNRTQLELDFNSYDERDTETMLAYLKSFSMMANMQELEDQNKLTKKDSKK